MFEAAIHGVQLNVPEELPKVKELGEEDLKKIERAKQRSLERIQSELK